MRSHGGVVSSNVYSKWCIRVVWLCNIGCTGGQGALRGQDR